ASTTASCSNKGGATSTWARNKEAGAMSSSPSGRSERDELLADLAAACALEPELWATVRALADAGELELLRLVRDFRDNLPAEEILKRHGPEAVLNERLRVVHR